VFGGGDDPFFGQEIHGQFGPYFGSLTQNGDATTDTYMKEF